MSSLLRKLRHRAAKWISPGGQPSGSGGYQDAYRSLPAPSTHELVRQFRETVYSCASLNSEAVAATKLTLFATVKSGARSKVKRSVRDISAKTRGWLKSQKSLAHRMTKDVEVVEVEEHPILALLERPGGELDGYALIELTNLYQELCGRAHWQWVMDPMLNIPKEIWVLPSYLVQPIRVNSRLTVDYYSYMGDKQRFQPDELLNFKFTHPTDPYGDGLSPARALYETINLADQDRAYARNMMANRGRPDFTVSPKDGLGADEADALEKKFMQKFRRAGNGRPLFLTEDMTVTPLNFTSDEMEALARAGVNAKAIRNAYKTPEALFEGESINRATLDAALVQHGRFAIAPRMTRFCTRLNHGFVNRFWGPNYFIWFDNPVPEDEELKSKIRQSDLSSGHLTINDTRTDDGRDTVPWGDEPWLANTLSQPSERPEPAAPGDAVVPPDEDDPKDDPPKDDKEKAIDATHLHTIYDQVSGVLSGKLPRKVAIAKLAKAGIPLARAFDWTEPVTAKAPPHSHRERTADPHPLWYKLPRSKAHRRALPQGTELKAVMQEIFREQRAALLQHYKSAIMPLRTKAPFEHFDLSGRSADMAKRVEPSLRFYYDQELKASAARLAMEDAITVKNPKITQAIHDQALKFCTETNETTSKDLNTAIEELRARLSESAAAENIPVELAKSVSEVFENAESWRADMIALTESSKATHTAQIIAAKESGVVEGMELLLSDGACPECVALKEAHPGVVPLDQVDEIAVPDATHPRCQCTLIEAIKDLSGEAES